MQIAHVSVRVAKVCCIPQVMDETGLIGSRLESRVSLELALNPDVKSRTQLFIMFSFAVNRSAGDYLS